MPEQFTALMPMKGHSERVPDKNLRPLAGRPLCLWMLEILAASSFVAEILVNTDNDRIRRQVENLPKAKVIDRPEALCGDFVPMNAIIAHDLNFAAAPHILQTHSTNPLFSLATLEAALAAYLSARPKHDSLFTVTARQGRFYQPDGRTVNHDPAELKRTQDLEPIYEENSCLYVFSSTSFQAAGGRRIGLRPLLFPIAKLEAVDIDDEDDFILAEALITARSRDGGGK